MYSGVPQNADAHELYETLVCEMSQRYDALLVFSVSDMLSLQSPKSQSAM